MLTRDDVGVTGTTLPNLRSTFTPRSLLLSGNHDVGIEGRGKELRVLDFTCCRLRKGISDHFRRKIPERSIQYAHTAEPEGRSFSSSSRGITSKKEKGILSGIAAANHQVSCSGYRTACQTFDPAPDLFPYLSFPFLAGKSQTLDGTNKVQSFLKTPSFRL